ncbi:ABC transporter ATP-binding protein [Clostridium sp.]|uniref:ABC transporter ATP-binding protein n=1 Tax=Clostridium sp. TaxID=1506 RepID=UPI0025C51B0E|nr:ABC transporter ATP-binding protein [Clostridium sp.]
MINISYIEFQNLSKKYKNADKYALKNIDFKIEKGEFVVILGPSGSGKSTLLDLICGFEDITEGEIIIDGKVINDIEPKNRDVSMVFQNYALYPHLTAYENIAFGMKIRKENKKEIHEKVMWAAKILKLEECLKSKPKNLSGGQRQRIALARAMVRNPKCFLMDEPLSNLDAKLRNSTSNEIRNLHNELNATTIYVTHDQVEALSMADKIVILNNGEVQQIGSPLEIYNKPSNIFVATFIGRPQINLLDVTIDEDFIILGDSIKFSKPKAFNDLNKGKYIIGIRSEDTIKVDKPNEEYFQGTVEKIEYLGSETIYYLRHNDIKVTLKDYKVSNIKVGDIINISFNFNKANIFNILTKQNIRSN